jgi:hypothetical protein
MDKVYYLDLNTLLEYLQGQSALLITEVAVPGQREPSLGYLFFKNVSIIGCVIQLPGGTIWREGEQAYHALRANGEWRVRMDPDIEQTLRQMKQQSGGMRQVLSLSPEAPIYAPRPLRALDPALLERFPPRQRLVLRLVFAQVNGQRTPAQIKAQLRLPGEAVEEALASLYSLRVIE